MGLKMIPVFPRWQRAADISSISISISIMSARDGLHSAQLQQLLDIRSGDGVGGRIVGPRWMREVMLVMMMTVVLMVRQLWRLLGQLWRLMVLRRESSQGDKAVQRGQVSQHTLLVAIREMKEEKG